MTTICPASSANELTELVRANLAAVHARIRGAGGAPERVRVVAVTKGFAASEVRAAYEVGLRDFGENYVEELVAKRPAVGEDTTWHFLGALQTNKIARVLRYADVLSALVREREIEQLAKRRADALVDVEVDFTGDATRHGVAPDAVHALVGAARAAGLRVRGLMVVAPRDGLAAERAFRATVALADELGLDERSMGMSDDLEAAVRAGTTEVRIGRALFGPRVGASHLA